MKSYPTIIIMLCIAILTGLAASCSDSEPIPGTEHPAGSIVLRLYGGSPQSRTELTGSYNLHNVRQVYAVLFRGDGDDATYVCHQDLGWNPKSESDYGEGVQQIREFEMNVPATLADGDYTVLCVGLDDSSGPAYSLSLKNDKIPPFCFEGKTVADARAELAAGQSMTKAELFAGWSSFSYSAHMVNRTEVELTRRVAGVYAYLKDIPVTILGKEVKFVRLVCGNAPSAGIGLLRKPLSNGEMPDDFGFGAQEESARVLDQIDLGAVADPGADNMYEIKSEYTAAKGLGKNTLLLGAYILPMAAGSENTFSVELLDASQSVIKAFPALWQPAPEGIDIRNYPVYPDYIYHVGTRGSESDRPVSLAGDRIELVVQPWHEVGVDIEFPNVPLDASIGYDKNPSSYIYDCINTIDTIQIFPSLMKKDWRLTVVSEDKNGKIDTETPCDWLYFKKPDGTYTQEIYSGSYSGWKDDEVKIIILINDFVVERDIEVEYNTNLPSGREAVNTDWRRARIVLRTDESSSSAFLSFRQYNAITVKGRYEYVAVKRDFSCGFSRYDMGVKRDANGNIESNGSLLGWGFWNTNFFGVHQPYTYDAPDCRPCYDGEECYNTARKNDEGFGGSLIDISHYDAMEWTGEENSKGAHFWYAPSQLELYSFFNSIVRYGDIDSHVVPGAIYWSGTAYCDSRIMPSRVRSYRQKTSEIKEKGWDLRQSNYGYSRRARKF